jgi:hypothetical protein
VSEAPINPSTTGESMRPKIRLTLKWWYWLAAELLLSAAVAGWSVGLALTFIAVAAQIVHFAVRTRSMRAFSVQTATAFLVLLALGVWPPLAFLHWLMLAGTAIRLLFDYCLLARTLSLAPWNRTAPLSWTLIKHVYLAPPVDRSILAHTRAPVPVTELLRRAAT